VKFSYRQIAASAAGAVLSAVIASIFGVKGTIVGVAIGSIAATTGTALVFQSIERTNKAVKQVVVHVPDNAILRRLGGTKTSGVTSSEPSGESAVHEETATSAAAAVDGTVRESRTATGSVETSERTTTASATRPAPQVSIPWQKMAGVVVVVFVVSLLFVTAVELIAGRPLADIFGHGGGGTTVEKIFETPATTLPPPTTTTTSTSPSTATTSSSSTTTSTVGSTTSLTAGGSGTTTSSPAGVSGSSTSTTAAAG
jgi:hypothetical protein